jgi:hypothetical protein
MYPACLAAKGSVHFAAGIAQSPLENTFIAHVTHEVSGFFSRIKSKSRRE